MRWPWLPPSLGDIKAIALLIAICLALIIVAIKFKGMLNPNASLGAGWDCTILGYGSACIKHVPAGTATPSH